MCAGGELSLGGTGQRPGGRARERVEGGGGGGCVGGQWGAARHRLDWKGGWVGCSRWYWDQPTALVALMHQPHRTHACKHWALGQVQHPTQHPHRRAPPPSPVPLQASPRPWARPLARSPRSCCTTRRRSGPAREERRRGSHSGEAYGRRGWRWRGVAWRGAVRAYWRCGGNMGAMGRKRKEGRGAGAGRGREQGVRAASAARVRAGHTHAAVCVRPCECADRLLHACRSHRLLPNRLLCQPRTTQPLHSPAPPRPPPLPIHPTQDDPLLCVCGEGQARAGLEAAPRLPERR